MKILLLNGPNLNMLGTREPEVYGSLSLQDIENQLQIMALQHKVELSTFQSNAEHELVEQIQQSANQGFNFILINPAAFTHTSVSMRDALASVKLPFIEIHLSNPHAREPFRKHSYFSDLAIGIIAGFGAKSYLMAFESAVNHLRQ